MLGFTLISYLDPIIKIIYANSTNHLNVTKVEQKLTFELFFDLISPQKTINPINGEIEFVQECKIPFSKPVITSCLQNLFLFANSKTHDLFGILIHIDKSWETFKENSNVEISSWTTQNNKLAECFIKYFSKQLKLESLTQTVEENIKKMISKLLLSSEKILIADFINSKTKKKNYPTLQLYSLKKSNLLLAYSLIPISQSFLI